MITFFRCLVWWFNKVVNISRWGIGRGRMWTSSGIIIGLVVAVWIDSDDICVALLSVDRQMWRLWICLKMMNGFNVKAALWLGLCYVQSCFCDIWQSYMKKILRSFIFRGRKLVYFCIYLYEIFVQNYFPIITKM